jgi:hypothetical protein
MRKTILPIVFIALAQPTYGQDNPFDDLLKELETLSEEGSNFLRDWAQNMRPTFEGLADQIPDLDLYQAPEILENGDIIIRRKPKAPAPDGTTAEDHIEL